MPYTTLITGGTLHTAHRSFAGEIGIIGEKIAAVGSPGSLDRTGVNRIIDAAGMDVIPGCLDVHVHLALPFCGTVSCDDFDSGSRAAACGCVTTVIDFAIPADGQSLADADAVWHSKADGNSIVDYAWHLAITKKRHLDEIPAMIQRGLPTFKQFMIYEREGWNADDAMMFAALEAMKQHGGMLLVHAESPRVLDLLIARCHTPELMRRHGARLHRMTRPNFIEAEAIERAIHWSKVTGGSLYIVHMSTEDGADLVRAARAGGVPVMAETCVQYLCLDDRVFDREDGHLFACCPQVKKPADVERLWRGLGADTSEHGDSSTDELGHRRSAPDVRREGDEIAVVSTDTCSFTRDQKAMWLSPDGYGDWTAIPMGLPGLDTMVPLLYTLGVRERRISMNDLVRLCATNPARLMGLDARKGDLAPGFDADVAIIDPSRTIEIIPQARDTPATIQSRCDWSPYEGWKLGGFAHTTLVRGTVVVRDHRVIATPGHGRFLERRAVGRL